ncbi:MAG TPA: winged helix-turn-helix transcriptional regulator [Caldilineae bacterium]|nr:winged helix-turn-helix transcriptional regulator [Caldilineae bacterium]
MIPPRSEVNRLHAELCTALADPIRITLLYTLAEQSSNVSELTERLSLPQSTVSRHLRILRTSHLVHHQRSGRQVLYSLEDRRIVQALDLLRQVLGERVASHAEVFSGRS